MFVRKKQLYQLHGYEHNYPGGVNNMGQKNVTSTIIIMACQFFYVPQ